MSRAPGATRLPRSSGRQRAARWGFAAALVVILGLTLTPASEGAPRACFTCMFADDGGLADAIANVMLFVPLGIALALNDQRGWRPIAFGGLLSLAIEMTQNFIPGRDPSLRDVLTNALGAGAGQWLVARSPWLVSDARRAAQLSLAWSVVTVCCFGLTAVLLAPAFPATVYMARWAPDQAAYEGRVLSASVGPLALPPQRLEDPDHVRASLLSGDPLEILATAGPAVREFKSLFRIRDDRHHELVELGPDRADLVLYYQTRAETWHLERQAVRLPGAFEGIGLGDTLRVRAWRQHGGVCLRLNDNRVCPTGFTVGSGWSLLWSPEHLPSWLRWTMGVAWLGAFFVPLGFWSRRRPESFAGLGLGLVGITVLPPVIGLLATPASQVSGAVGGCLLGLLFRLVREKARPVPGRARP
jgi:hypothetical protein